MKRTWTIIGVADVARSFSWYQTLFGQPATAPAHDDFGQIVDAMAGVAAEAEYVSDDLLLLHRAVFVGGSVLDVYAEDAKSQFQKWLVDEHGEPFWKVVTGLETPPFLRYRIDLLGKA